MSMLSLEPAATMSGCILSMATAGSFCLFCENGVNGLPTDTRVSCAAALLAVASTVNTPVTTARARQRLCTKVPPSLVLDVGAAVPVRGDRACGSRRGAPSHPLSALATSNRRRIIRSGHRAAGVPAISARVDPRAVLVFASTLLVAVAVVLLLAPPALRALGGDH